MLAAPRSRQIWYRSCVLLTTLLLGLLSMSIDLLEDHTTLATSPASNHSETGSKLHLVRRQVDGSRRCRNPSHHRPGDGPGAACFHSETASKLHLVRRQVDGETGSRNVCFIDN